MPSFKELQKLTILFVIWRVILFAISLIAPFVLSYHPSFPYSDQILPFYSVPQWIYSWANFDGVHYLTIAEKGYVGTASVQAFFPLFPYVILHSLKLYAIFPINILKTGLFLTNFFAYLLIIVTFSYVKKIKNTKTAWMVVAFLVCFPTSFFLGAFYTESLFLTLVISAFYAAEKRWWFIAAICVALASADRVVGIFLIPALLIELAHQQNFFSTYFQLIKKPHSKLERIGFFLHSLKLFLKKNWTAIGWILLSSVGLVWYMFFLNIHFHDPLYFVHVQASFGSGRSTNHLVSYPQVVLRSVKILFTARPFDLHYWAYIQEFLAGTLGLIVLIASIRFTKFSHVFFALCAFILPTLTGTFSSMPRYLLVCFPIFVVLAELQHKRPKLGIVWFVLSCGLLIFNTILFIQGYWVA